MDADIQAVQRRSVRIVILDQRTAHGIGPAPMRPPIELGDNAVAAARHNTAICDRYELTLLKSLQMSRQVVSIPQEVGGKRLGKARSLERHSFRYVLRRH